MKVLRIENGTGHKYETDTGQPVPGVTTIIGKAVPKPALVPWAARETAAYAVDHWAELGELPVSERIEKIKKEWRGIRDRAAARGTQVHAYGEALVHGSSVDVPPELLPYVEPYAKWIDQWGAEPVHVESVVWSEAPLYAGTLDLIADLGDGKRWLLDIKTSGSGVYGEVSLQLSAYRWADYLETPDGPVPMPEVGAAAVIWLPGDNTAHMLPVASGPTIYASFVAAHALGRWTDLKKSELVGRATTAPVQGTLA